MVVQREDGLRLAGVDPAIAPTLAAQAQNVLRGNVATGFGLLGQCAERIGHGRGPFRLHLITPKGLGARG